MRRRFFIPPESTALSLVVTPARDIGERTMLAVWEFEGLDTRGFYLPGVAWSKALDGWFQYVPETQAGTPTTGPWVSVPAMDSVVIDLRNWPATSSATPGAIEFVAMTARVRGSSMVASTLGEAV